MKTSIASLTLGLLVLVLNSLTRIQADEYDPLLVPRIAEVKSLDLVVKDSKREREIPIRVYLPPGGESSPVVLFSHGLGGSREGSPFLGKHWPDAATLVA